MTNKQEILFRGFHPCEDSKQTIYVEGKAVNGQWVEGAYSPYDWTFSGERRKDAQIICFTDDGNDGMWASVIPSTVGQYIGLTDTVGNKIFEHDILLDDGDFRYKVKWIGFYGWHKVQVGHDDTYHSGLQNHDYYEVIGTIFDVPEEQENNK